MTALAQQIADAVAHVGEVRAMLATCRACAIVDARLIAAALSEAEGHLLAALAMATEHDPGSHLVVEISRAERAGDDAEVDRLLRIAADRAHARTIAGDGFAVHPAQKESST